MIFSNPGSNEQIALYIAIGLFVSYYVWRFWKKFKIAHNIVQANFTEDSGKIIYKFTPFINSKYYDISRNTKGKILSIERNFIAVAFFVFPIPSIISIIYFPEYKREIILLVLSAAILFYYAKIYKIKNLLDTADSERVSVAPVRGFDWVRRIAGIRWSLIVRGCLFSTLVAGSLFYALNKPNQEISFHHAYVSMLNFNQDRFFLSIVGLLASGVGLIVFLTAAALKLFRFGKGDARAIEASVDSMLDV